MKILKLFGDKRLQGKYCPEPFKTVSISPYGDVSMCGCTGWMPSVIGNIFEEDLLTLLSGPEARLIRESIRDGSFRYCNHDACGAISNNQLTDVSDLQNSNSPDWLAFIDESVASISVPSSYFIAGDQTCNISCPSCRIEIINLLQYEKNQNSHRLKNLSMQMFSGASNNKIDVRLSTTGEVFASKILLDFLKEFPSDQYPNVEFWIQTNGLLAKKNGQI